jgi:hypothetical protein
MLGLIFWLVLLFIFTFRPLENEMFFFYLNENVDFHLTVSSSNNILIIYLKIRERREVNGELKLV